MNKTFVGILIGTFLAISFVNLGSAGVILDHPKEKKFTQWIATSGTVESIDADSRKISIRTKKGSIRKFRIDRDVRVIRDKSLINLSDVKSGDSIRLRYLRAGLIVTTIKY